MQINKTRLIVAVKIALIVWGAVSLWEGAALSFFVSGAHQYRQDAFIELVYVSVFIAGFISFLSSRIAGVFLCGAALVSVSLLYWTGTFGHGPSSAPPLLLAIAMRPALGALVLLYISFYEGFWAVRIGGRLVTRRPNDKPETSITG